MARVVLLSGGTGGAKLAAGLQDVLGTDLTVVANTGDDLEIYGAHVSPDPDLITFWLAGTIDERGWGIQGDTFNAMDELRKLGQDVWFNIGDRDLAICLERKRRLDRGERLTTITSELAKTLGTKASVLPMCDEPVRTVIHSGEKALGLQEFLISHRAKSPIDDVEFVGIDDAQMTSEVLEVIDNTDLILIGPSNPVISIEPILAVPGARDAVTKASAPVVAISPIVRGAVLKGPTSEFMRFRGVEPSTKGFAELYHGIADAFVVDEEIPQTEALIINIDLSDETKRRDVAKQTLDFGLTLNTRMGEAR